MQSNRSYFSAVLFMFVAATFVSPANAVEEAASSVDPTGTYTWERTRGDQTFASTLKLARDGSKLTGTYKGRRDEVKIEKGKIDGDAISFQITRTFNEREFSIKYQGKVSSAGIKGTIAFTGRNGEERTREWEAKRIIGIDDVVGVWKLQFEGRDGNTRESTLTITRDGDKAKGVYASPRGEREVKDIAVKDGALSFGYSRESDRGSFSARYEGKLDGNSIKGTMTFKFGENERTREFTGRREVKAAKKGVQIADVVGTWKIEVEWDNGQTFESSIAIKAEGEKLSGHYTSRFGEREAKKLALKDGVLSFELSGETDNGNFLVTYSGEVDGNSMKGTSSYEFGDQKGSREFTASREAPAKAEPKKKAREEL